MGGERMLVRALPSSARRWHPRARVADRRARASPRARPRGPAPGRRTSVDAAFIVPAGGDAALSRARAARAHPDGRRAPRDTRRARHLRTVGAFAALDSEDVERRWGDDGLAAWRLARGEDVRRPVLARRRRAARGGGRARRRPRRRWSRCSFSLRAAIDRLASALAWPRDARRRRRDHAHARRSRAVRFPHGAARAHGHARGAPPASRRARGAAVRALPRAARHVDAHRAGVRRARRDHRHGARHERAGRPARARLARSRRGRRRASRACARSWARDAVVRPALRDEHRARAQRRVVRER